MTTANTAENANGNAARHVVSPTCQEAPAAPADEHEQDVVQDAVIGRIGKWGVWQLKTVMLISLIGFLGAWQVLVVNFSAPDLAHWCARPRGDDRYANWTGDQWKEFAIPLRNHTKSSDDTSKMHYSECEMYDLSSGSLNRDKIVTCHEWEYDHSVFPDSQTSDWNLVCSRNAMRRVLGGVYMAGYLVGVLVFGIASDRFGRRKSILISSFTFAVFSIATALCNDVYTFMFMRFATALGKAGATAVSFVLMMEMIGGKYRSIIGILAGMFFSVGAATVPAVAYFVRHWRHLQLAVSLPCLLMVLYVWYLPESPRWLLSQGRTDEAENILEEAEICNGKRKTKENLAERRRSMTELQTAQAKLKKETEIEKAAPRASLLDLFKTPNMRKKTLNIYYQWFVNAFVFYGLSLNVGDLGGDVYLNAFFSGVVEVPAVILAMFAILYLGRRWPMSLSLIIGGLACMLTVVIPSGRFHLNWPIVLLASIGKLCITSSFGIIYVVSAEIFPTVVRTTGVGSSSMCARIGSIIAPIVPLLDDEAGGFRVSMLLFGCTSIVAGLSTLLLPETNRKQLPETIEEGEKFK